MAETQVLKDINKNIINIDKSNLSEIDVSDLKNLSSDTFVKESQLEAGLNNKVDKVAGKGLSTNDLTDELKNAYDQAVTDKHTHTNKNILDATTASFTDSNYIHTDNNYTGEDKSKLAGISAEANKVVVFGTTPNGYVVIDGTEVRVFNDAELRGLIAGKETGWVINTQDEITGNKDDKDNYTNVTKIGTLDLSILKIGDNVYIKDKDVPDYWVSNKQGTGESGTPYVLALNTLNTKIDLTNYYNKDEIGDIISPITSDISGLKTKTTNISFANGETTIGGTTNLTNVKAEGMNIIDRYGNNIPLTIGNTSGDISEGICIGFETRNSLRGYIKYTGDNNLYIKKDALLSKEYKLINDEDLSEGLKDKLDKLNYDSTKGGDLQVYSVINGGEQTTWACGSGVATSTIVRRNAQGHIIVRTDGTDGNAVHRDYVDGKLNTKQDVISDLSTIRSGASKGNTALQSVKTINGQSIVGTGNINISGGSPDYGALSIQDEVIYEGGAKSLDIKADNSLSFITKTGNIYLDPESKQIIPPTDKDGIISIGHSSYRFKNGYFSGQINCNLLSVSRIDDGAGYQKDVTDIFTKLDNLPDTSNFVTTNTNQEITGVKHFYNKIIAHPGNMTSIEIGSPDCLNTALRLFVLDRYCNYNLNSISYKLPTSSLQCSLNFPAKSGTIATTDDIPSTYIKNASVNNNNTLTLTKQDDTEVTFQGGSDTCKQVELKNINGTVVGNLKFVRCTQAEYDALEVKDDNTMYLIKNI